MLVKKTTLNNFTNASLNGDYWIAHLEYNNFPYHRTELGTLTFDGSGNFTANGAESRQGTGANIPVTDTGTYSVTPDGQISFDGGNIGRLSDNGDIIIASNVSSTSSWEILMLVKKTDTGDSDGDGGAGGCFIGVINEN
jgi:hypothetical protein